MGFIDPPGPPSLIRPWRCLHTSTFCVNVYLIVIARPTASIVFVVNDLASNTVGSLLSDQQCADTISTLL